MSHPHDHIAICASMGILFDNINPPVPDRRFDWGAYRDGEEECGMIAYGRTQQECAIHALEDLDNE
jgi:hypothetical protein